MSEKNMIIKKVRKSAIDILSEGKEAIKAAEHQLHQAADASTRNTIIKTSEIISDVVDSVEDFSTKSMSAVASVNKDAMNKSIKMQKDYFKYLPFNDLMLNNIKLLEANFIATNKLMSEIFSQMINISKNNISIVSKVTHK